MSSSSSSSAAPGLPWSIVAGQLRGYAKQRVNDQSQATAAALGSLGSYTLSYEINNQTGSPPDAGAVTAFRYALEPKATTLNQSLLNQIDTTFNNYQWPSGNTMANPADVQYNGPTVNIYGLQKSSSGGTWQSLKLDINAQNYSIGTPSGNFSGVITITSNNLSYNIGGAFTVPLESPNGGSYEITGRLVISAQLSF